MRERRQRNNIRGCRTRKKYRSKERFGKQKFEHFKITWSNSSRRVIWAVLSQPISRLLIQPIVLILLCKINVFRPSFMNETITKLQNWYLMLLKNQNQMRQITRWTTCNKQVRRCTAMMAAELRSTSIISQHFKRVDTRHLIRLTRCDC